MKLYLILLSYYFYFGMTNKFFRKRKSISADYNYWDGFAKDSIRISFEIYSGRSPSNVSCFRDAAFENLRI